MATGRTPPTTTPPTTTSGQPVTVTTSKQRGAIAKGRAAAQTTSTSMLPSPDTAGSPNPAVPTQSGNNPVFGDVIANPGVAAGDPILQQLAAFGIDPVEANQTVNIVGIPGLSAVVGGKVVGKPTMTLRDAYEQFLKLGESSVAKLQDQLFKGRYYDASGQGAFYGSGALAIPKGKREADVGLAPAFLLALRENAAKGAAITFADTVKARTAAYAPVFAAEKAEAEAKTDRERKAAAAEAERARQQAQQDVSTSRPTTVQATEARAIPAGTEIDRLADRVARELLGRDASPEEKARLAPMVQETLAGYNTTQADLNAWNQHLDDPYSTAGSAATYTDPVTGEVKNGIAPQTRGGGSQLSAPASQYTTVNPAGKLAGAVVKGSTADVAGLTGPFADSLARLIADAPGKVEIYSAFRSNKRQAELFAQAVRKYGSEDAARKWVAPPGKSQHNEGEAVDLRFESPQVRDWVHANASNYGLGFPLGHEPWHIEPLNARSGVPSGRAAATSGGDGSRSWRNNNPGNLRDGEFARSHGAVGKDDKGFAVFPTEETGQAALEALLQTKKYSGKTIAAAMSTYAPASDSNNPVAYAQNLARAIGAPTSATIASLTPQQFQAFTAQIRNHEGWKPGAAKHPAAGSVNTGVVGTGAPGSSAARGVTPYPGAVTTEHGANVLTMTQPDPEGIISADLLARNPAEAGAWKTAQFYNVYERLWGAR